MSKFSFTQYANDNIYGSQKYNSTLVSQLFQENFCDCYMMNDRGLL